ncbi:inorganic phosphate transporter [candidate division KSB1 bacterium]|nr:inorganic phosphate transporter [candidate division KSB1 bacterium]
MLNIDFILLSITIPIGFYMAWNIGANDVANAMGTSVGSGALTLKQAVIAAAIFEFAGAFFVGANVTDTVRKGLFNPEIFSSDLYGLVFGMMAALLAAGVWLQLATYFGLPVSTTHSIVGAVVGFVLILKGYDAISWAKVGNVVASWFVSPLMSGVISFTIFTIIRRKIFYSRDPMRATKQAFPYLVFIVFVSLTLVIVFKGLSNLNLDLDLKDSLITAGVIGLTAASISLVYLKKYFPESNEISTELEQVPKILGSFSDKTNDKLKKRISAIDNDVKRIILDIKKGMLGKYGRAVREEGFKNAEKIFAKLQILSACFVAFTHGANDVANAIGPLAAIIEILRTHEVSMTVAVPLWVLALGGIGIVVGLATWGFKVIFTIGSKITDLTPTRGFSAELGAAITIAIASKMGLPISTTHTLVGAVLGVGFARGVRSINLKVLKQIAASWFVTLPASAVLTIIFMYLLRFIFGGYVY